MTRKQLESRTRDELVRLARERGLRGWKEMTKATLIESLSRPVRKDPSHPTPSHPMGLSRSTPAAANGNGKHAEHSGDADVLQNMRKKDLARTAKEYCVSGWHSMSKDELIRAISSLKPADRMKNGNGRRTMISKVAPAPAAPRRTDGGNLPALKETIERIRIAPPEKDLSAKNGRSKREPRDRIVAMVRDPFWLHVCWEISTGAIRRTEAALGHDWYNAKPILRLIDVTSEDTTTASESVVRDIPIHGGVNNWYLDVQNPPRSYRIDIGYLSERGRFFVLARSNIVATPRPGGADSLDGHWRSVKEDFERIFARSGGNDEAGEHGVLRGLFEERLRRPMSTGTLGTFGAGALGGVRKKDFHFQIDAELIVYGSTDPSAKVSLQGEPVPVRQDGSFTLRFGLPEGRLILPACAQTRDGIEERTIILAIERNTKELEPMIHDGQEL